MRCLFGGYVKLYIVVGFLSVNVEWTDIDINLKFKKVICVVDIYLESY